MEIKITSNHILKVLQVVSWIIFLGLCVEAGGLMFNLFYTFFINPVNTNSFWEGADLSALYAFDKGHFMVIVFTMIIISVLKAIMFYQIVKLFVDKKLNISQPFSTGLRHFLVCISYLALGIGIFCNVGLNYSKWLISINIKMPDPQSLGFSGGDVWIFTAIILFVIVYIIKRGIEIQKENDLTI